MKVAIASWQILSAEPCSASSLLRRHAVMYNDMCNDRSNDRSHDVRRNDRSNGRRFDDRRVMIGGATI